MPSETLTIDAAAEDAANTQVLLDDAANGIRLVSHAYPDPEPVYMGASSADTEGTIAVQNGYQDRTIPVVVRCFNVTSGDGKMRARIKALQQKVGKLNREGGTLRRTLADSTVITFDVKSATIQVPADWHFLHKDTVEVTLSFLCDPLGRAPELTTVLDEFTTDTIANYTFDTGSGLAVSGGQLAPSSTAEKRIYRSAAPSVFYDPRVTLKITTGASANPSARIGVSLRRTNAANNLLAFVQPAGPNIRIAKRDGGTYVDLASPVAITALATTTSYWLRFAPDGNLLTAEWWTTDPALGGSPATTVTHTLAGANLTAYGAGISGQVGIDTDQAPTDWRYDDFRIEPWAKSETTLPAAIGVHRGLPGDAPGLGRLEIVNDASADQWHVVWGMESRYYSSAATAALFYQAESLLAQGGSSAAAVASASGGTVMRNTALSTSYQSIVSGREGGTAYFTHQGDYEVWGRFMASASNVGTVSVALEWSHGDFRRFTRNGDVTIDPALEGQWARRSLGLVHLPRPVTGDQRWEPRILAKSTTAGDDVDVDYLFLVPVTEGSGVASAAPSIATPTTFSARDEFDQAPGALAGKTAAVGGNWANNGANADFAVASTTAQRTATSDSGREIDTVPVTLAAVVTQADLKFSAFNSALSVQYQGVTARYVDATNYAYGAMFHHTDGGSPVAFVVIGQEVAGAGSVLASAAIPVPNTDAWYTLRFAIDATGRAWLWFFPRGGQPGAATVEAHSTALATGGALDDGYSGLYDYNVGAATITRSYDNFWATPLTTTIAADAAIFAGQSMQVRHNAVVREDSGGSVWARPASYEGDHARPLPAGVEARALRTIVAVHRNDPGTMADTAIDDLSYRWHYTPRWVSVPQP